MTEPLMFFGIGFLLAALGVLVIAPLVHFRAVRLTTRQLEASIPLTMAEIQADKDLLRAEFAMSTRRLETNIEQLKAKGAGQRADLGRKCDEVNHLKINLSELRDRLRTTEGELRVKSDTVHQAERALSEKELVLVERMNELEGRSGLADVLKAEIITLKTQVEVLKQQLSEANSKLNGAQERYDAAAHEARRALSKNELEIAERTRELERRSTIADAMKTEIITLNTQVEALKQQLDDVNTELNGVHKRHDAAVHEARRALSEKELELAERVRELGNRSAIANAQKTEIITLKTEVAALRQQLDGAGNDLKTLKERSDAERIELKSITQKLMDERTRFESFHLRVTELVQQLMAQRTDDEILSRRAQELESRLIEQSHLLKESELKVKNLRGEVAAAHEAGADLRSEFEGRVNAATETFKVEKARLQGAIDRANGERVRLAYELANVKRYVEEPGAAEPTKSARLSEVADGGTGRVVYGRLPRRVNSETVTLTTGHENRGVH